jgi:hypothetical protein
MAGLVPAIHVLIATREHKDVDAQHKGGCLGECTGPQSSEPSRPGQGELGGREPVVS